MKQAERFGRWLGEARRKVPLTQMQLAEILRVEQPTISYWETEGREWMLPDEIRSLALALRVEPVEVADALGYPTRPRAVATLPLSADEWFRQVAELGDQVLRLHREWAADLYPPHSAEHGQNDRNG